jgi:hypothetical protein
MWCRRWSAMDRPGSTLIMNSAEVCPQCKATTRTLLPSTHPKSPQLCPPRGSLGLQISSTLPARLLSYLGSCILRLRIQVEMLMSVPYVSGDIRARGRAIKRI